MKIKNACLILLGLTWLASCAGIKIKDSKVCAVAGVMSAGMDCAHTLNDKTYEINLDETIAFLEPKDTVKDKNGKIVSQARGAAMCQSAADWNQQKTDLEEACKILGSACSFEMQQTISIVTKNLDGLQAKVASKAKKADAKAK